MRDDRRISNRENIIYSPFAVDAARGNFPGLIIGGGARCVAISLGYVRSALADRITGRVRESAARFIARGKKNNPIPRAPR